MTFVRSPARGLTLAGCRQAHRPNEVTESLIRLSGSGGRPQVRTWRGAVLVPASKRNVGGNPAFSVSSRVDTMG
jgi:hypothetical protein